MTSVIRRPQIVILIDSQSVRVGEKPATKAAKVARALVVLGEHGLSPLKQKNVPFRIQCHRRGFSNTDSVWRMKEIRDHSVAQFRDGLKTSRVCILCLRRSRQTEHEYQSKSKKVVHGSSRR